MNYVLIGVDFTSPTQRETVSYMDWGNANKLIWMDLWDHFSNNRIQMTFFGIGIHIIIIITVTAIEKKISLRHTHTHPHPYKCNMCQHRNQSKIERFR